MTDLGEYLNPYCQKGRQLRKAPWFLELDQKIPSEFPITRLHLQETKEVLCCQSEKEQRSFVEESLNFTEDDEQ